MNSYGSVVKREFVSSVVQSSVRSPLIYNLNRCITRDMGWAFDYTGTIQTLDSMADIPERRHSVYLLGKVRSRIVPVDFTIRTMRPRGAAHDDSRRVSRARTARIMDQSWLEVR